MKKIIVFILSIIFVTICIAGCTEQGRAKSLGGTYVENLPKGRKFILATWKDSNLWIITKPMKADDVAETYEMTESSAFGVFQGKVIIKESK